MISFQKGSTDITYLSCKYIKPKLNFLFNFEAAIMNMFIVIIIK